MTSTISSELSLPVFEIVQMHKVGSDVLNSNWGFHLFILRSVPHLVRGECVGIISPCHMSIDVCFPLVNDTDIATAYCGVRCMLTAENLSHGTA